MKYLILQASGENYQLAEYTKKRLQENGFCVEDVELENGNYVDKGHTINITPIANFDKLFKTVGDFVFGFSYWGKLPNGVTNTILIYDQYIE